MKNIIKYILYRIYRHGLRVMAVGKTKYKFGAYFYLLGILSIIPAIFLMRFVKYFGIPLDFNNRSILNKIYVFFIFLLPTMLLFSSVIKKNYLDTLSYTKEKSKKYRNKVIIIFLIYLLYLAIRYKLSH